MRGRDPLPILSLFLQTQTNSENTDGRKSYCKQGVVRGEDRGLQMLPFWVFLLKYGVTKEP